MYAWRKANPEKNQRIRQRSYRKNYARTTRPYKLLKQFGITQEQYDAMLAAQGGYCAICLNGEFATDRYGEIKDLAVDHDHRCCPGSSSCGRCARRLLCSLCNTGIGWFRDNPALLRAAADYLERNTQWQKTA